jgi:hypothetical protein
MPRLDISWSSFLLYRILLFLSQMLATTTGPIAKKRFFILNFRQ